MSVSNANGLGLGVQRRQITGKGAINVQPRAGVTFQPGSLVCRRIGSQLAEVPLSTAPRADLINLGYWNPQGPGPYVASSTLVDALGGEIDANGNRTSITVSPLSASGTADFATGTGANLITAAMVDQPAYMFDDDTYYATDLGNTLSFGGWIVDVDQVTGRVTIKNSEQLRQLYELYSAGTAPFGSTQDDTVAGVITNLPAGTWNAAGNVFTVTATGAMPTQDTNITAMAIGDKFIFPAGTLTTQAVTAAQSGVYECTVLGATGVAAVFTRTAKFQLGAIVSPKTKIRVGSNATGIGAIWGGTEWSTRPATNGLLVGTGDPQLMPDSVTVTATLAASTVSITSVPINANTKVGVFCQVTGGSQASGTVGFGTLVAPTVGGVGTGTVVVDAFVANYTKNGTADTSVLSVTIRQ